MDKNCNTFRLNQIKPNSSKYLTTKDFLVTGERFELRYCQEFEMLITHLQPEAAHLSKYYESDDYVSHSDSRKGWFQFVYQTVKNYSLRKKIALVNRQNNSQGSLLDIGAGTGEFLRKAEKDGWKVTGVEPNTKARDLCAKKEIQCYENIDSLAGQRFDVVTLWHVLEHMPDLQNVIKKLEDLVAEGGSLVIAVPNFNSYDAEYYNEYWAAFDVPRHLWHFSQKSFPKLFTQFRVVDKKPMWFDSFYVSLLSEKYRGNKFYVVGALLRGGISNIKAMKTKEFSSIIYILKR
ncbi:MAG: methyltransferase [Flavobacteriaceae bacterium]|nr:methyltransferase [Flavobacteriaceae bacterium]